MTADDHVRLRIAGEHDVVHDGVFDQRDAHSGRHPAQIVLELASVRLIARHHGRRHLDAQLQPVLERTTGVAKEVEGGGLSTSQALETKSGLSAERPTRRTHEPLTR